MAEIEVNIIDDKPIEAEIELPIPVPLSFSRPLLLLVCALFVAALTEALNWYTLYRKDDYKSIKQNIDISTNKLKKLKESEPASEKSFEKKKAILEQQIKGYNQEMNSYRMKSTLFLMLLMIGSVNLFGSIFQGQVMAKLPFTPISIFQGVTHRGLDGEDATDCSYLFLYILSIFVFRTNIQKVFGFEAPRNLLTPWGTPAPRY